MKVWQLVKIRQRRSVDDREIVSSSLNERKITKEYRALSKKLNGTDSYAEVDWIEVDDAGAIQALHLMLQDYRTGGCSDKNCGICKRSDAAELAAYKVLQTLGIGEARGSRGNFVNVDAMVTCLTARAP